MTNALKPGDPAPRFDLPTAGGGRVRLEQFQGKWIVLFFYPKDDTPTCTQEALNFTEKSAAFAAAKAVLIGVSRDSLKRHENFTAKYGLKLLLASDAEGEACAAYDVWREKKLYGRVYMGIERSTFLIDPKGRIAQVWRKVKVAGHADEVLTKLAKE